MDGVSSYPRWKDPVTLENTNRCPRRAIPPATSRWIDLYPHYRAGHLLRDGGLERQPALYLAAMRLIEATASKAND